MLHALSPPTSHILLVEFLELSVFNSLLLPLLLLVSNVDKKFVRLLLDHVGQIFDHSFGRIVHVRKEQSFHDPERIPVLQKFANISNIEMNFMKMLYYVKFSESPTGNDKRIRDVEQ